MANFNFIMLKTVRLSGWPLLAFMILYLTTGSVLCGRLNLGTLLDSQTALTIHKSFVLPLAILLAIHVLSAIYMAFRRWKWIGRAGKA